MKIISKRNIEENIYAYIVDKSPNKDLRPNKIGVWNQVFFRPQSSKQSPKDIIIPSKIIEEGPVRTNHHNVTIGRLRAMSEAYNSACIHRNIEDPIITLADRTQKTLQSLIRKRFSLKLELLCNSSINFDDSDLLDDFIIELLYLKNNDDFQYCGQLIPLVRSIFNTSCNHQNHNV